MEACGDASGCDLERRDAVTLGSVFVDGEALVTLPDASEIPGYAGIAPDGQILLSLVVRLQTVSCLPASKEVKS